MRAALVCDNDIPWPEWARVHRCPTLRQRVAAVVAAMAAMVERL